MVYQFQTRGTQMLQALKLKVFAVTELGNENVNPRRGRSWFEFFTDEPKC